MWGFTILFALGLVVRLTAGSNGGNSLPVDKIYGVNLGGWLLLEPWMLPNEWVRMGGETCFENGPCSGCAASEFDLVKKLGQEKADEVFQQHWETWFSQSDVNDIVDANLNTVRIPTGYWIVEGLVDRATEFYARGGLKQLKRGLAQLKRAGVNAIVDFHAMPGVSSSNQMFAGHCTSDVQFYTPPNYFRALEWAAVMTYIMHTDSDFKKAFALEAVNEPLMDHTQTPGYGDYLHDFTLTVRAMENLLGIECSEVDVDFLFGGHASSANRNMTVNGSSTHAGSSSMAPTSLAARASLISGRVGEAIRGAIPMIRAAVAELEVADYFDDQKFQHFQALRGDVNRQCIHTTYMDVQWQGPQGPNPASAAVGPALFDDHLYFSFGGVADPNAESYLATICNIPRLPSDNSLGNNPMVFGEWSLATNFNANDSFVTQWADAQKLMYSQSNGWIFWSSKIEDGNGAQPAWDYFTALKAGHFTRDPAALRDPHVCDAWRK